MTLPIVFVAGILWTGMLGQQLMECDVIFATEQTPPPTRSSYLQIGGTCSANGVARDLNGWDSNGPIQIQACDALQSDCCDFLALGPSADSANFAYPTPEPKYLAGTYQCGGGPLGVFAIQPGVCKPRDEGSACPKIRRKVRKHRRN
jgi:hypothetical protein